MSQIQTVPPLRRRGLLPRVASLVIGIGGAVAIAGAIVVVFETLGPQPVPVMRLTSLPPKQEYRPEQTDDTGPATAPDATAVDPDQSRSPWSDEPGSGAADGVLPAGVSVFDDEYPGVTNLNPKLLQALREAALDAADYGVPFYVTSGWRSPKYQEQLLQEAIIEYGSVTEAARWVATADTSLHVRGNAVDIGDYEAMAWLEHYGANYGLCRSYSNEPWHYELRPEALKHGCPQMYPDPTADPRLQNGDQ
ncbi:MAG: M15 family metallopeptidase [Propionibacteriaceae bacterium]|jgi:LAS superfamily LD-carboxypeptidase LdcB|nr:M15 family metallopeptidase [Propionibacteriaceae bacterium]